MPKNISFDIPDHEPLIKALREDIGTLAKKVKELNNREIPIPKDYDPELSKLNKELETIKSNVRTTVARLSTRIDDITSKPESIQKDYSPELVKLGNQLAKVEKSVLALDSKKNETEPLKQDVKGIKANIDDLYKSINRVIDAMNSVGGKGGRSTYVLEQRGGGSSTAAVNKTDYTAKGDILAGSAAGAPTVLPIGGTTGYVLSVDPVTQTGLKWISTPAGTPSGTVVAETAYSIAANAGTSAEYSRGDHTHGTPDPGAGGTPSGTTVALTAYGASSAAGTSAEYSRGDHSHGSVADLVSGTAHATLATGVHGAGTATIATTSDITTHAALTSVHSLGSASTAASTYFATTTNFAAHTASATTHGAGTIAGLADITTHAALTSVHSLGSASTAGSTYFATATSLGTASTAASTYFATATSLGTASTAASTYFATATSLGTASTAATADIVFKDAFTAKGTLLAGSAASSPTAFALGGTTGYVLSVSATATTGLDWVAAAGGTPSGTTVALTAFGASSAAGTSSEYSRGDHSHGSVSNTGLVLKTAYTSKGTLLAGSAVSDPTALAPSGTNGYVLQYDSTEVTGLKWASAPAGTPAGTTVALTAYGASSAAGTSAEYSRGDHSHGSVAADTTKLPKQMTENDPLLLDAILSATGQYSGVAISGTSDAALIFGQLVYKVAGSGRWGLAAATVASGVSELGMCVQAATGANTTTTVLLYGDIMASALTCCVTSVSGSSIYISATAGSVVLTAPAAASAIVRVVGYATPSDSTLSFRPGSTWVELGASGYTPGGTIVAQTVFGAASAVGASAAYARTDHAHGTPVDPVAGTAHATLNSGVHGAGTATIATTSDITTHAALTSVHSLGSASTAASTYFATTAAYLPRTMIENEPLILDNALSATGQYSGIVISGTSDAALTFGQVLYNVGGSARWGLAAATAANGVSGLGICVLAATGAAATTTVLLYGNVCAAALTACALASAGSAIYISNTAGSAVIAAPTTGSSIVRVIGHSLAASTLVFRPDGSWIELA